MKKVDYVLFNEPISRRTYYWLLFLCPPAAFWIYFFSRRAVSNALHPHVEVASRSAV